MTEDNKSKKTKPCPICKKPMVTEFEPFCSARCKQIDLGKWFTESYRVPTDETDEETEKKDNENEE